MQTEALGIALCFASLAPSALGVQDDTCKVPFEAEFKPGGKLHLQIRPGNIEITGVDASAVRVSCELGRPEDAKNVIITFESNGNSGNLRIRGGPNHDVRFRIEVPRQTHLFVRSPAGDLKVSAVTGNKDIELYAGDLTIAVENADDYAYTEASVWAGDLHARAFGVHKGGLFRSFKRENARGKYRLHAGLWAGDLTLK